MTWYPGKYMGGRRPFLQSIKEITTSSATRDGLLADIAAATESARHVTHELEETIRDSKYLIQDDPGIRVSMEQTLTSQELVVDQLEAIYNRTEKLPVRP